MFEVPEIIIVMRHACRQYNIETVSKKKLTLTI